MTVTTSVSAGISQRTNLFAEANMLAHAGPVTILDKLGRTVRMPKNKSTTIKFRRPKVFTAKTTPLVEGVTPTATVFEYEDVQATLRQYGEVVVVTDVIADTHEDPVLRDATQQAGENIGRTIESLTYAVLRGGTNVFYAGTHTARVQVATALTLTRQRAVVRSLRAQKGMKLSSILSGSPDYNTTPIEAAYIAVAHTDLESDIRNLAGFVPVAEYGSRKMIMPEEIGSVEDVRYILSPDLAAFADAGGAAGTSWVSTTGTSADVYPILYFAKDAFGVVAIRDQGSIEPTVIQPGTKTKDDPLGQRGYIGWKTWFASVRLNEAWMARLEVAATKL